MSQMAFMASRTPSPGPTGVIDTMCTRMETGIAYDHSGNVADHVLATGDGGDMLAGIGVTTVMARSTARAYDAISNDHHATSSRGECKWTCASRSRLC